MKRTRAIHYPLDTALVTTTTTTVRGGDHGSCWDRHKTQVQQFKKGASNSATQDSIMNAHIITQITHARINCALKDSSCDSPLPKILKLTILASNASSSSAKIDAVWSRCSRHVLFVFVRLTPSHVDEIDVVIFADDNELGIGSGHGLKVVGSLSSWAEKGKRPNIINYKWIE
ncbi:hypothetical protein H5410_051028 [Solanum commersonii]|uniref:Uncharacterized protein n=1 Tax=Solanum commersonii TaxID=4109 RepID=A0A9J5WX26_SOLCO|nr:hypothetical protein H5410_051028 [Solanum commersonii]